MLASGYALHVVMYQAIVQIKLALWGTFWKVFEVSLLEI